MVFRLDPCGLLCIFLTHAIILYSDYVVVFYLITPVLKQGFWAAANIICFNVLAFLLVMSHLCAVLTNPGLITIQCYPIDHVHPNVRPKGWTVCNKCGIYRPPRAHHCRICRRCVRRMDHHCPWINNCVGEFNQKYFIQFLLYVGMFCIYTLTLVLVCRAILNTKTESNLEKGTSDIIAVAHTIVLVALACLFGLFILAILSDQYKSIVADTTAVEAWKLHVTARSGKPDLESGVEYRRNLSKIDLFCEVFGQAPWYFWLLPCPHLFEVPTKVYEQLPPLEFVKSSSARTSTIGSPSQFANNGVKSFEPNDNATNASIDFDEISLTTDLDSSSSD